MTYTAKLSHLKYRPDIDGLRTLAVLPVILFHAGFPLFSGGFVGVDIFFVISGYLITTIILSELERGDFSIINFYERRARRILPALFFVMLCCLPFAWLWLLPQDMKSFSQSLIAVSMFGSNFFFWSTSGYFDVATELKPMLHTWSLSVEEQYYVFFPLFLIASWRLGRKWVLALLMVTAVVSLLLAQYLSSAKPDTAFYLLPTRAWELMVGALVAFYYTDHNINKHKPFHSEVASFIGLFLICTSIFLFNSETPFPSFYTLMPTLGAALIIAFNARHTFVSRILGGKVFVGVGLISYSAYLWHQPLFAFARTRSIDHPPVELMGFLVALSLILALFTWRFIERPFRSKHLFSKKHIFIFSFVGAMAFSSFGLAGHLSKGFNFRLPEEQSDVKIFGGWDLFNGSRVSDESCGQLLSLSQLSEEVCLTNTNRPKIFFIGDSHVMALYSSIYSKKISVPSMLIAGHSCPFYPNLIYTPNYKKSWGNNCTQIANEALRVAKEFSSIDTIVLNNFIGKLDDAKSQYWLDGVNLSNRSAFRHGYDNLISKLLGLGKRVIFVVDVPPIKSGRSECFQNLNYTQKFDCRQTVREVSEMRRDYISEIALLKARNSGMEIFDPLHVFCGDNYCEAMRGGKSLYNDQHHISVFGSELLMMDMQNQGIISPTKE